MSRPAPGSVFLQQSLSRDLVNTTPGIRIEKKEGRAMEGAGSLQQHFVVPDMVPPSVCCMHKKTIGVVDSCLEPILFYVFFYKKSCVTIDTYSSMIGLNAGLVY